MIKIQIEKESMNHLFFDALPKGKNQFVNQNEKFSTQLTFDEYDHFMKDNNLITYKNQLKQYEDGKIIGTFINN